MNKRGWSGMVALLLAVVTGLTGCGPASTPPISAPPTDSGVSLVEDLSGTVPLGTENRAALAEAYDTTVNCETKDAGEQGVCHVRTIVQIGALEGSPHRETVWNWIRTAREELAEIPGAITENATVDLGYLSIRLSVIDPLEEYWSGPFHGVPAIADRTAVFDLETGRQLALADLFYENIPVAELINRRLLKAIGDTELKRPFTGFPADYPYFGLAYNSASGTTQLILYCNRSHPFWPYDSLSMELACYASPAGHYYYDVSYERLITDAGQETMVPTVTINDGTMPEADAAINAAVEEMVPRLQQADLVFYPYLSITESRFYLMYLERDYVMPGGGNYPAAAVPGCIYTYDLEAGGPVSLEEDIPEGIERKYYELTGKADPYIVGEGGTVGRMDGYTPPEGSVLSDFTRQYWLYFATLTEPSGRRILVEFCTLLEW